MAIVLEGDGTITGVTTFTTPLDDIKFDSINVTGIATAGTFQAGTGVSMASPRSQNIALFTNNVEGLTLDDAGRLGIGISIPNQAADANNVKVVNAGIITANQYYGNQLTAAGVRVTGVSTFAAVTGTTGTFSGAVSGTTGTFTGDVDIADKIVHTGDTDTAIRFPSADTITAETGGSERLRITSGGNVNIGGNYTQTTYDASITTAAVNKKVSFGAAAHDDLSNEGSGIFFSRQNDGSAETTGLFSHSNGGFGISTREDMTFHTGGGSTYGAAVERLRITSAGLVGIGTDNPIAKLIVNSGTTDLAAQIVSDDANVFLAFKDGDSTGNQQVQIGGVGNNFVAYAGGSERARIDSSGRLLIGTTTEGQADADNLTINDTRAGITIRSASDNFGNIYFSDATSGSGEYAGYVQYSHGSNYLLFGTNATDQMRITSTGELLIGTSTNGESGADDLTIENTAADMGITLRSGTSNNGNIFFSDGTSGGSQYAGYFQYRHNGDKLVFGAGSTEKMHLTSTGLEIYTGNGAGAADPGYGLKVFGGTNHRDYPAIYLAGGVNSADNSGIWAKYNLTLGCDQGNAISGREIAFNNGDARIAGVTHDGITFGNDSAAANALDDYEEGTFTAAITVDTGTNPSQNAYSHRYAYYTKIGNVVHFKVDILFGAISQTGSGNAVVSGLPYAALNQSLAYGMAASIGYSNYWGTNNHPTAAYINANASEFFLMNNAVNDGDSYVDSSNIVQNTRLIMGGTYLTN